MQKTIKEIIKSMDTKLDREDAESKAIEIYRLGPAALNILIELGQQPHSIKLEGSGHRKFMRAIIFAISLFAQKNKELFKKSADYDRVIMLLSDLAYKGFTSATAVLNRLGISEADIHKKRLLSLPLKEKHRHDKETSLSEAVEEIKLSASLPGAKGLSGDHYCIGEDEKYRFAIYKIGKNLFGIRAGKKNIKSERI